MGATSTESRKPSRRSSITDIAEKMEVKSTTITTVPGKKYCRYPGPEGADGG